MLAHWFRKKEALWREKLNAKRRPAEVTAAQRLHVQRHPFCEACGSSVHVQAHHILPFHLHPELGAAPSNFISLCIGLAECHLRLGHGGDFNFWNPNVVLDTHAARRFVGLGWTRYQLERHAIDARARAARLK